MIKLAFFDVDGTLSAPVYLVRGKMQLGMDDKDWTNYKLEHGEDTYEYCRPVPAIGNYARCLKEGGAKLFVLSASENDIEDRAKIKFVKMHYGDIFDEFLFVRSESEKVTKIKAIALNEGYSLEECEIVEDTYKILLDSVVEGIKATHVANIYSQV